MMSAGGNPAEPTNAQRDKTETENKSMYTNRRSTHTMQPQVELTDPSWLGSAAHACMQASPSKLSKGTNGGESEAGTKASDYGAKLTGNGERARCGKTDVVALSC